MFDGITQFLDAVFDGITPFMAATGLVAMIAIVASVVIVGGGRGGELSAEHADYPPLALPDRRPVNGTDAALLRLPFGLWGYHQQVTDAAMWRFAQALTERDTRIAVLEQQLAEARRQHGTSPVGAAEPPPLPDPADDETEDDRA